MVRLSLSLNAADDYTWIRAPIYQDRWLTSVRRRIHCVFTDYIGSLDKKDLFFFLMFDRVQILHL